MTTSRMILKHLFFLSGINDRAGVRFEAGSNLIYGASNTGKSFVLKSLDFMLGSQGDLPAISEREGYESVLLGFLIGNDALTLVRRVTGGRYFLYEGLHDGEPKSPPLTELGSKHDATRDDNLSNFLLKRLELSGRSVVTSADGKRRTLSFRDLVRFVMVNETDIQIEQSPVESGQYVTRTAERSVFRLLLSGNDDVVATPQDQRGATISRGAHIELLDNMIEELNAQISSSYPEPEELEAQIGQLENSISSMQLEIEAARKPLQELLGEKREVSRIIPAMGGRLEEIETHLERFALLDAVFKSDLQRLEALEEASFLVGLGGDRKCPVCGAPPEAQEHHHHLAGIKVTREAAVAEMQKIHIQQRDLQATAAELSAEREKLQSELRLVEARLEKIETDISDLTPNASKWTTSLQELLAARDRAMVGKALLERKQELTRRRAELEEMKPVAKPERPKLAVPGSRMHELCKIISSILTAWDFPGDRAVSFDEKAYDIRIDGKLRTDNGKGVRAVTHAAVKLAILKYCRENALAHPSFLVLDTPLLAYRDPMRDPSKEDPLTEDEKVLIQKPVKQRFFEFLHANRDLGQFIVLENIDPPANIERLAHVEIFYGPNTDGRRRGLFP